MEINLEVTKYYLMPSLQHVSMSNIIIILWTRADIKYQIVKIYNFYDKKKGIFMCLNYEFRKIEDKVLDKVRQLNIPSRFRNLLSNTIHPVGMEIFNWINHQDQFIFSNPYFGSEKPIRTAINYIDDLVWTPRGVIDYKETAKTLLTKKELFDTYKYNIACAYCLEDDIAIIASKFIDHRLVMNFEIQAMVSFWTAHLTGDFTELIMAVNNYNQENFTNYSVNECVFRILIKESINVVAIKYIWYKLNSEEKSKQIVSAIKITSNIDIKCFLLSQITKEQEKGVYEKFETSKILLDFLDNWLWKQYFLHNVYHLWDILSTYDYFEILKAIADKMKKNDEKCNHYKFTFMKLWKCAPRRLKKNFFEYNSYEFFFTLNMDIMQLILADMKDARKKAMIFSKSGTEEVVLYLISNQWDLFEILIKNALSSEEEVESYKQKLIKEKGLYITGHFIKNKEWNKAQLFLQWTFKSEGDLREFKSNLVHVTDLLFILNSLVASTKAEFMELEYFLNWCASGDLEKIVEMKKEIPSLYFKEVAGKLIENDNYDLLTQILNWCFLNDPKQIYQFKQYYYQDDPTYQIEKLTFNLIALDDRLQSFKKFVYYWCLTDKEIKGFKKYLFRPTVGICEKLKKFDSQLYYEFIKWYFS